MDIHNRPMLKQLAAENLSAAPSSPKKQLLLHTGAVLLISLLLTVVDFLLDKAIADTGGLSGLGTRSLLSTVQSCLRLTQMIILPFWQIGYTYITLKFARKEATSPADLCFGFHTFFPILRLLFFKGLLYLGIGIVSSQIGSFLFMLTPWATPLLEAFLAIASGGDMLAFNATLEAVAQEVLIPLMLCYGIAFLAIAAPFYYRFRLAEYVLLDEPKKGALWAMRTSWRRMRGKAMALLKLDISFWWFFVLDLLVSVIAYADALLPVLGVSLPISGDIAFFATFFMYLGCQLALYWWRKNEVSTTYALFYEALRPVSQDVTTHPDSPFWTY